MAVKLICSMIEVLRMNVCYCSLSITEVLAHKNSGLNIWDKAVPALFSPIFSSKCHYSCRQWPNTTRLR